MYAGPAGIYYFLFVLLYSCLFTNCHKPFDQEKKKGLDFGDCKLNLYRHFFYLQNLVDNHQLILRGKYEDASMYWGKGLANVYVTFENSMILILLFSVTQIVFWILYRRKYKQAADRRQIETLLD